MSIIPSRHISENSGNARSPRTVRRPSAKREPAGRHKPAILGHWIGETRGRSNGSLRLDTGQSRPERDRLLGFLANCQDARFSIWTAFPTDRHDRRLVEDDTHYRACRSVCSKCRDQSPDRLRSSCADDRTFKFLPGRLAASPTRETMTRSEEVRTTVRDIAGSD